MDMIGTVTVVGGAILYIASAFVTFRALERGKATPSAVLYVIVKGVVLSLVCAFVPSLLLVVNAARTVTDSSTLVSALVVGFTLVLPLVYSVVVFTAIPSLSSEAETGQK